MHAAWVTFRKEVVDALRDRRTLAMVFVSSVLLGPLVLIALSGLIASFEAQAERRVVYLVGAEHAPSMRNFFERQTYEVRTPPADYEARLRDATFGDPVVVAGPGFEAALQRGEAPVLELVLHSANKQAEAGARRVARLVDAYTREQSTLTVLLRGVSPELLRPIDMQERDLASAGARAVQLTGMLPFFVLMAMLYGALNAALDTTAGERERGSLEPLLTTPADRISLVIGKWGAAACLGMLIAVLSCLSFLPAQWLLRSDTLQAMFQFGWPEVAAFLALLLPLAAALAAVLMAVAIRCRTFKEAQASSTLVVLGVSLVPLVSVFNQAGDQPWHLWVPALAQNILMTRVLKGEEPSWAQLLLPLAVCAVVCAVALVLVARGLRQAATK
jgi:sodium transport system permease protein